MSQTNRKTRLIIGMAVALLLPLSFYAIAKFLGKDQIRMPRYFVSDGKDVREVTADSLKYIKPLQAGDLIATNQLGEQVSLNDSLKGKILVVDFFFVNCPSICPRLTGNMKMLQNAYRQTAMKKNADIVQFISITVNPERDDVAALREYADKYGADHDHWWFLTGDKKALYDYARNEVHVSAPEGDGGADDFVHTEQMILLDRERYIRGVYNGLDSVEVNRCANDIALLDMEKKKR